jgi:two-component system, chemotaxis family, sensor histidine kinase and response regulator WspE
MDDLNDHSMAELFRMEVEAQSAILTDGLLLLERNPSSRDKLQDLMRAAHSLKGAARIVGRQAAAQIAHAMEDCIVAVQKDALHLTALQVNVMLDGVDLLVRISQIPDSEFETWQLEHQRDIEAFLASLSGEANTIRTDTSSFEEMSSPAEGLNDIRASAAGQAPSDSQSQMQTEEATRLSPAASERTLRITADNLNRLLGLAGEALVASQWLDEFVADSLRVRRLQRALMQSYDRLGDSLMATQLQRRVAGPLRELHDHMARLQGSLTERLTELEQFDRRFVNLSSRLYQETLNCRMRPFAEGVRAFPRMIRDLAHSLGKTVRLDVAGDSTTVDRDILERLQAPLDHLLRNAVDHGIEMPSERHSLGKPEHGTVRLEARHSSGVLLITVRDDGRGIDPEAIRRAVIGKDLATTEMANKMSHAELFEFLLLPGFTLKESVSEISGRGVGLDVVQTMTKQVGGNVRVSATKGEGACFHLELPLTLSVIRTLLVEIGGEPYAFPLARIDTVLKLPRENIHSLESRQYFSLGNQQIGLVAADQVLELDSQPSPGDVCIVVLGQKTARYGLVVDRFLGEQELVVRTLDPRLGKVKNISAASLMPDGSPVLIVDVDDLLRQVDHVVSGRQFSHIGKDARQEGDKERKRVLVVDDSVTVRELERKLLGSQGYSVDVAVDGMDGWNAVRTGNYDLVVTDVDMPRLDGIELVTLIRKDDRLKSLPVMIVSYKDREEDKQRGLEAGADYYLTKGSFHDQTLVRAVADLIGGTDA